MPYYSCYWVEDAHIPEVALNTATERELRKRSCVDLTQLQGEEKQYTWVMIKAHTPELIPKLKPDWSGECWMQRHQLPICIQILLKDLGL